ncbi:MAG: hypothetical protein HQK49_02145 [Oligoflexia bacterium]|nr:hypothetical protein [Oligoflexia bacterium]
MLPIVDGLGYRLKDVKMLNKNIYKYLLSISVILSCEILGCEICWGITLDTGIKFRTDYQINNSNDNTLRSGNSSSSEDVEYPMSANKELDSKKFDIAVAQISMDGEINNFINYFSRWNLKHIWSLASNNTQGTQRLKFSDSVPEIGVDYKLNDYSLLKIGKIYNNVGGSEGQLSEVDIYLRSIAGENYQHIDNKMGFALQTNFNSQNLFFSITNSSDEIYNQQTPAMGAVWFGSFMNERINPIVSFHFADIPAQSEGGLSENSSAVKKQYYYLALGSTFQFHLQLFEENEKRLILSTDYLKNIYKNATSENTSDSDESMIASLRYDAITIGSNSGKILLLQPILKFERSKRITEDSVEFIRHVYSIGLEYHPEYKVEDEEKDEDEDNNDKKEAEINFHLIFTLYSDLYKKDIDAITTFGRKSNGNRITTSQWLLGFSLEM